MKSLKKFKKTEIFLKKYLTKGVCMCIIKTVTVIITIKEA